MTTQARIVVTERGAVQVYDEAGHLAWAGALPPVALVHLVCDAARALQRAMLDPLADAMAEAEREG